MLKAAGRPFEVVWLSCERDDAGFRSTFSQMPWPAVPFDDDAREQALGHFKVTGIPRLVILGPGGNVLVENAAGMSLSIGSVDTWLRQSGAAIKN